MTNKILVGSIWAASLAVAYLVGYMGQDSTLTAGSGGELASQSPDKPLKRAQTKEKKGLPANIYAPEKKSSTEYPKGGSAEPVEARLPTQAEETSEETNTDYLLALMKSDNPIERMSAFTQALKTPTSANLKAAIEAYEALPGGFGRASELKMLTYAWAQVDPEGALAWMEKQDGHERRVGFGTILHSWAEKDSEAAIAWAKAHHEGEDNPYFIGIVNGMADNNLAGATELMMSLPYGRYRGHAATMLMEKQWNKGEDVALRWVDTLEKGTLKDYVVGRVAGKIAREDLSRAATWAEEMPEGGERTRAVETVADRWAEKDPVAAAQWVDSMPAGESRSEGMQEVVREWARKDPAAAAQWLNKYPASADMDKPVEALVRTVATKDPKNALTWAESITDEKRRAEVVKDVNRIIERQQEGGEEGGDRRPDDRDRGRRGPPRPPR